MVSEIVTVRKKLEGQRIVDVPQIGYQGSHEREKSLGVIFMTALFQVFPESFKIGQKFCQFVFWSVYVHFMCI